MFTVAWLDSSPEQETHSEENWNLANVHPSHNWPVNSQVTCQIQVDIKPTFTMHELSEVAPWSGILHIPCIENVHF